MCLCVFVGIPTSHELVALCSRIVQVVDDVAHMSDWYMASAGADAVKSRLKGQEDGSYVPHNRPVNATSHVQTQPRVHTYRFTHVRTH